MRKWIILFLALINTGIPADEAADAILADAAILGKAPRYSMTIEMVIAAKKGNKERQIEIFFESDKQTKKTLIQITSPSFLRDMKFLAHDYADNTSARWLKTSQGTRRITQGNSAEKLFDSDFTVDDFSAFNTAELDNKLLEDKIIANVSCFVVESTVKQAKKESLKKVIYIDQTSKIVMQVDFLNAKQQLIRQYQLLEMQKAGNLAFPARCKMSALPDGTATTITIKTLDTQKDIPDKYFNQGNL